MKAHVFNLEQITTKNKKTGEFNGIFVPVWRNWDSRYNFDPQMAYITTIPVSNSKGPHLHKIRTGYLTCLCGEVVMILKHPDGEYEEILAESDKPRTVEVLPGTGFLTINIGKIDAMLLNLCNPAWHPDNQDNYTADFSGYDFSKWTRGN